MSADDDQLKAMLAALLEAGSGDAEGRALRALQSRVDGLYVRMDTIEARISGMHKRLDAKRKALHGDGESPGLFERLRAAERLVDGLREDVGRAAPLRETTTATRDRVIFWGAVASAIIALVALAGSVSRIVGVGALAEGDDTAHAEAHDDTDAGAAGAGFTYGGR